MSSPTSNTAPASGAGGASSAASVKAQIKPNGFPRPGDMGNTVGCIVPKTRPLGSPASDKPQTEEEGWWDKLKQGSKEAAQYYKDNVSQALHEFGANAMETGGKVAMAGEATALAGGAVAMTGIGAPVGVGLATVGGATATAGGVAAGVGAGAESAATALDTAADWVTKGQTPDLLTPAVALGERVLSSMLLKKIPGMGGGGKTPPSKKPPAPPGGGYILGGGSCIVGTYEAIKNKCSEGQQAHHIIPDTLARTGNRKQGTQGIGRVPGMPTFGGGPSICLQGHARTEGSEHNTAHQCDNEICKAANGTHNGPKGTLPVSEAVPIAMNAAIAARPDCKAQIEAEVRKAYPNFEKDNRSMNGAGKPASGDAKAHLENGGSANSDRTGRTGGRRGK